MIVFGGVPRGHPQEDPLLFRFSARDALPVLNKMMNQIPPRAGLAHSEQKRWISFVGSARNSATKGRRSIKFTPILKLPQAQLSLPMMMLPLRMRWKEKRTRMMDLVPRGAPTRVVREKTDPSRIGGPRGEPPRIAKG